MQAILGNLETKNGRDIRSGIDDESFCKFRVELSVNRVWQTGDQWIPNGYTN